MKRSIIFPPKSCAFCGDRTKLTREHVFADWLAPYLPEGSSGHAVVSNLRGLDGASLKMVADQSHSRQGSLHNLRRTTKKNTLKVTCEACNTGWMSRLQEQVKPILLPMIQGEWPEISSWQRRILAAWAVMFTMIAEFADQSTQSSRFEDRERLRLTLTPPPHWYVWAGLFQPVLWTLGFNHFGWSRPRFVHSYEDVTAIARKLTSGPKEMQSTGWVLGKLYLQSFSSIMPDSKMDQDAFAEKHNLRVIWPDDGGAIVRPIKVLEDIDADSASTSILPSYFPRTNLRRAWDAVIR
jgi:hypothetical protein